MKGGILLMDEGFECPYCSYLHQEWWEYIDGSDDDVEFTLECISCDKSFKAKYHIIRIFDSEEIE